MFSSTYYSSVFKLSEFKFVREIVQPSRLNLASKIGSPNYKKPTESPENTYNTKSVDGKMAEDGDTIVFRETCSKE